jgi:hypothetical protein
MLISLSAPRADAGYLLWAPIKRAPQQNNHPSFAYARSPRIIFV